MRTVYIATLTLFLSTSVFAETYPKIEASTASECSHVFNYAAASLNKTKHSKDAGVYYNAGGALSNAVVGFGGNFAMLQVASIIKYQNLLDNEEFLITEIGHCEKLINANTDVINSFGSKYQIPPNITFNSSALKRSP